jgi:drug/metabolite transporter (DMT)-like permease
MTIGALRFLLALGALLILRRAVGPWERLDFRDLPALAGAGLFGITLYFWLENTGLTLIPASEASIITGAIPALSMLAEEGVDRLQGRATGEAPRSRGNRVRRWLGVFISVAGVFLVAKVSLERSGSLRGYLLMAGACVCWVAYNFFIRALSRNRTRLYILFWQSLFGLLGFLPFAILDYPRWGRPSPLVLGHLLFLGLFCSALAYWLYARAISVLGIGLTSLFINFIPVITVITGMLLLQERLSPLQWAGAALVLAGVYLAMMEG